MSKKDPRRVTLVWLDAATVRGLKARYPRGPMADRIRRAVVAAQGLDPRPVAADIGPFRVQLPRRYLGLEGAQIAGLVAALERGQERLDPIADGPIADEPRS